MVRRWFCAACAQRVQQRGGQTVDKEQHIKTGMVHWNNVFVGDALRHGHMETHATRCGTYFHFTYPGTLYTTLFSTILRILGTRYILRRVYNTRWFSVDPVFQCCTVILI